MSEPLELLLSFELPFTLPSLNDILGDGLKTRFRKKTQLKDSLALVLKNLIQHGKIHAIYGPVMLRYTLFVVIANRDPDNTFEKFCTDMLVKLNILQADRCKYLREVRKRIEYAPEGRQPYVLVEIFKDSQMQKPK